MTGPRLGQVAPILPVGDVAEARRFFGALGFEEWVVTGEGDYAILQRDGVRLTVVRHPEEAAEWPKHARQSSAYVWVEGLDALWEEWRAVLGALPETHVRPPSDRPHGMRELHVIHQSVLILFGEPVGS